MGFESKDSAYSSIKIEGQEIGIFNLVDDIQIIEHASFLVPIVRLKLIDASGFLRDELAIQDGTKISVAVGRTKGEAQIQKFRVFNHNVLTDNESDVYMLNCILDAPSYTGRAVRSAYSGSSNAALEDLAFDSDLTLDGTNTNDSQTWLGLGVTASTFAQNIASRGWVDEKSAMTACVDAEHNLIYKNLSEQMEKDPVAKINIGYDAKDVFIANDSVFNSNSGFRNSWLGTGQFRFFDDIDGEHTDIEKTQLPSLGKYAPINRGVKSDVGFTRVDTDDFGCGNTHENYQRAAYQNLRLRSMYSQMGSLLLSLQYTKLNLLDPIELFVNTNDGRSKENRKPSPMDGKWLVLGRNRIVRGNYNFAERVEIMRPYVTKTGQTGLVSY